MIIDSAATGDRLVKRVIGLPGDTGALRGNVLYVNGHAARYRPARVTGIGGPGVARALRGGIGGRARA